MTPPPVAPSMRVYDQTDRRDVEPDADGTYRLRCRHIYRLRRGEDPRVPSSAGSYFQPSEGSEWITEAHVGDSIGTLPLLGHVDHRSRGLLYAESGSRPGSAVAARSLQETQGERRRLP